MAPAMVARLRKVFRASRVTLRFEADAAAALRRHIDERKLGFSPYIFLHAALVWYQLDMSPEPDPSLPLVLIVDDDETDRVLAVRALRRIGVRNPIRVFPAGGEFMAFVSAATAEAGEDGRIAACVVFVDLRMPPPDGFEILSWVRTQPALSHVQVVVLTGSVDPKDMRRAAELHADLYLPKFPSDETLARVVSKASASALQALRFAQLR